MAKRSVIVTGAGSTLGAACARRFAAAGDRLVLVDRKEDAGRALAEALEGKGVEATFVGGDPAERLAAHNIVAEALETFGRVDVLVHANIAIESGAFLELTDEEFDRVIAANLRGAFVVNQAVARQLVKQFQESTVTPPDGAGAMINVVSDDAASARADRAAFAASEGGVAQLVKSMALALAPYGVRVNAVGVGAVKGAIGEDADPKAARSRVPMGRLGDAGEAAEAVHFLASPAASFITGRTLVVDGGLAITAAMTA
ncbi:MAG: SDR family NAD(P)-dependent oxidoreductase [Parvularculaceae bacterium]